MDNNRVQLELAAIALREDGLIESVTKTFRNALNRIVQRAMARLIAELSERLVIGDGTIGPTPGNMRQLQRIDDLFMSYLNEFGYQELLNSVVMQFDKQLPFLQEIIATLSASSKQQANRLDGGLNFTARELKAFSSLRMSARTSIGTVVEAAGASAMRQALLSISGLSFRDLADELSERLSMSVANAEATAATAMATYYRTISAASFDKIQEDLPGKVLRFRYYGPLDFKTRPFCRKLLASNKSYTRAEIDAMDNHNSLGNVWICGGGWNCRHSIIAEPSSLS